MLETFVKEEERSVNCLLSSAPCMDYLIPTTDPEDQKRTTGLHIMIIAVGNHIYTRGREERGRVVSANRFRKVKFTKRGRKEAVVSLAIPTN